MGSMFTRRAILANGVSALALTSVGSALAQTKQKLRFSCAFTENDPRADSYKAFAAAIKDDFDFEPYWGNTLFKQGTELVALQRDNLDLCNLAPADISKQIPAWSLLTSAYLFRDADHMKKVFKSDVGKEFIKMAKDQLGIQIITPVYFGSRNVNLKPDKTIKTPADLQGVKLRMPPGEFWQFLGEVPGRQSNTGGLRGTLHGITDGNGRRTGQPAGEQQTNEIRRGHVPIRAHPPRYRLRRNGDPVQDMGWHEA